MKNKKLLILAAVIIVGLLAYLVYDRQTRPAEEVPTANSNVECDTATLNAKKLAEIWGDSSYVKSGKFLEEIMPYVTEQMYNNFREELADSLGAESDQKITIKSDTCEKTATGAKVKLETTLVSGERTDAVLLEIDMVNLEGEAVAQGFADTYK